MFIMILLASKLFELFFPYSGVTRVTGAHLAIESAIIWFVRICSGIMSLLREIHNSFLYVVFRLPTL